MPGKFSRSGGMAALTAVPLDTHLALCTTAPTRTTLGTEYTATNYVRKACRRSAPTSTDPPAISNVDALTFGPFAEGVGATIGWVMMMSVATGGTANDMAAFWELDEHKTPAAGDSLVLEVAALTLNCS